ncbi:hypothetical protein [Moraxella lacunata]|uniref:hypothetical protein n=1 Tax=Moraxella lacunata TaxID=477 RepID=UPI003EE02938
MNQISFLAKSNSLVVMGQACKCPSAVTVVIMVNLMSLTNSPMVSMWVWVSLMGLSLFINELKLLYH